MEKAILKTLVYANMFDYPLKAWEIHKWLISKQCSLTQVEKALSKLVKKRQVFQKKGYYFLPKKNGLVVDRLSAQIYANKLLVEAKIISKLFSLVPFVRLVGISGSLALENTKAQDDIDLVVVTEKKRLWLTRLILNLLLQLTGKRRTREDSVSTSKGKFCLNLLLSENQLFQSNQNLYIAHEVLQMKPLVIKGDIYSRYLESNNWVFKFLPNWTSTQQNAVLPQKNRRLNNIWFLDFLEKVVWWLQVRYMGRPQGLERVSEDAIYFFPQDYTNSILNGYRASLIKLSLAKPKKSLNSSIKKSN